VPGFFNLVIWGNPNIRATRGHLVSQNDRFWNAQKKNQELSSNRQSRFQIQIEMAELVDVQGQKRTQTC
jgi:hypothetical protein